MNCLIQNEVIKDLDQQAQTDYRNKILSQKDLYEVLPFGENQNPTTDKLQSVAFIKNRQRLYHYI